MIQTISLLSILFLVFGISLPTHSDPKKQSFLICQNKEVVRSVRIENKEGGGCVALYTKEGQDEVVGKSSQIQTCEEVVQKIKSNLVKADWKCRDVSQRVSNSVQ